MGRYSIRVSHFRIWYYVWSSISRSIASQGRTEELSGIAKVFDRAKPLVITPSGLYSSYNVACFLQDIAFSEDAQPCETRVLPLPVTHVFGSGVKTVGTFFCGENGFGERPQIVCGDGDGTMNIRDMTDG